MHDNCPTAVDQVLERGEKIELLVDKTEKLNQEAFRFEDSVCILYINYHHLVYIFISTYLHVLCRLGRLIA